MLKVCMNCTVEFDAPDKEVRRGNGKFCSRSCFGQYNSRNRPKKEHNAKCAWCNNTFYINNSKRRNSRSGLFFCCRKHKDLAQRIGGVREIMPSHYGEQPGVWNYRALALNRMPNECAVCGYNEYVEVLEVHHIDADRTNSELNNLVILCPTHHKEQDYSRRGIIR